jgi:coniferyl-aldehyde dehydrogenase
MATLLRGQQDAFAAQMYPSHSARLDRLRRLKLLIETHSQQFAGAISDDFGTRSSIEVRITETILLQGALRHSMRNLARWMRPRRVPTALAFKPGRALIGSQPLGVVGIISPWNYPLLLAFGPLINVLAAGNRAMLKPSELTPRFSDLLQRSVAEVFTPEEVTVITGDAAVGKAFAALSFDHLVFTGSTAVGREVAQAAAKNLTPVTLELGGKSPAIIDYSCDLEQVIERLAWGKLLNGGQTCVAPDYVLVPRPHVDRFVESIGKAIKRLYPTFRNNPDYTSVINEHHVQRLRGLVEDARAHGAKVIETEPPPTASDAARTRRQLAPVLLLNVNDTMKVMQEEIFGPVLPIVSYDSLSDALTYVNQRPRPLALYWFGKDRSSRNKVVTGTLAGGVTINDTLTHVGQNNLPFGGVGASGQGHYHGEFGFRQFSKQKPVFVQSRFGAGGILRPPYKPEIKRVLTWLARFI